VDKIIHSREIEPRRDVEVRDSKTYKVRVSGLRSPKEQTPWSQNCFRILFEPDEQMQMQAGFDLWDF